MSQYSQIPLEDEEFSIQLDTVHSQNAFLVSKQHTSSYGNDPVPITKPPTKGRDKFYALLFLLHFVVIGFFTLLEKNHEHSSLILATRAGNWMSMVMISIILGSFFGSLIIFLLSNTETRSFIISSALPFSVIIQICLANILFFLGKKLFLLGILLFASAIWFASYYRRAAAALNFTTAVIQFVGDISHHYGTYLMVACASIVFLQTCTLLGWGVFLIKLLSNISLKYSSLLFVGMLISFYWITKLFQAFVSYIVGGCIVWYFIRDENEVFEPKKRIFFHFQCALTTSLGSLCKGALIAGFCDTILYLYLWSNNRGVSDIDLNHSVQIHTSFLSKLCNCKRLIAAIISPFYSMALKNHRLSYCLIATFGQTFSKTGENHSVRYPNTLELALTDISHFSLTCIAVEVAGLISIFFGLFSFQENKENYSEATFVIIIYFLAYSGLALCVEIYKTAIDALIVSYALKPDKLASEHQIIFLRFLRTSDPTIR